MENGLSVLLIEGKRRLKNNFAQELSDRGFDVTTVTSGATALETIPELMPNVDHAIKLARHRRDRNRRCGGQCGHGPTLARVKVETGEHVSCGIRTEDGQECRRSYFHESKYIHSL